MFTLHVLLAPEPSPSSVRPPFLLQVLILRLHQTIPLVPSGSVGKNTLERKGFTSSYNLSSGEGREGAQGRAVEAGMMQRLWRTGVSWRLLVPGSACFLTAPYRQQVVTPLTVIHQESVHRLACRPALWSIFSVEDPSSLILPAYVKLSEKANKTAQPGQTPMPVVCS